MRLTGLIPAVLGTALLALPQAGAETIDQTMDFAGNTLEVVQTDDFDRVLKVNGNEVLRDFQIYMERTIPLGGREVLLVSAGPGGNACGSYPVVLIPANDGTLTVATPIGTECGQFGEMAATPTELIFFGHTRPGVSASIDRWSPTTGLEHIGRIEFEPHPNTGWSTFRPDGLSHPIYLFTNEDIFQAFETLAGPDLGALSTSLLVAAEPQLLDNRFLIGKGCTPHACGTADGFIAVDLEKQSVYAATDATESRSIWPPVDQWPEPLRVKLEAWVRGER